MLAALSGFVRHRLPRLAVALGLCTLTGRHTCVGVVPAGTCTRVTLIPDGPGLRDPQDFDLDSRITLVLANRDAADSFVVGRSYFIDVTPDL